MSHGAGVVAGVTLNVYGQWCKALPTAEKEERGHRFAHGHFGLPRPQPFGTWRSGL